MVIWKNPVGVPPADAGAYDFVLRKQDGLWRVFAARTAYLQPLLALKKPTQPESRPGEWRPLFDGRTTTGWRTLNSPEPPKAGWVIEDGSITSVEGRGVASLVSQDEFLEFELEWEWKAAKAANSGVSYQVFGINTRDVTGMEYQIADDDGEPGAIKDNKQKAGALYGTVPVSRSFARPLGTWNQSRIVLQGNRSEHWLNGEKVTEYQVDGIFPSPVSLQHHGAGVSFRNVRIRPVSSK